MKKRKIIEKICLIVIICVSCFFICCCNKNKIPTPKYGTYSYTDTNGVKSTITITENTIKITNPDFTNAKIFYAIKVMQSYVEEMANEGIIVSEEEKQEIFKKAEEEADFTRFADVECAYKIEVLEEGGDFNILFCEDNDEVTGLFVTYYVKDKNIGFGEGYYTLE